MLNKLAVIAVSAVLLCTMYGLHSIGHLHLSLPKLGGSSKVDTDLTKLTAAFQSRQGLTAGQTDYAGITIKLTQQSVKFLPPSIAGNCSTLTNGRGKVTYFSDFSKQSPTATRTASGIVVTVPDPTPLSVGITAFDTNAIKSKWSCGLLIKDQADIQAINRELQKRLCDLAQNDSAHIDQRRHDVAASVTALAGALGVGNVSVITTQVAATLPAECVG